MCEKCRQENEEATKLAHEVFTAKGIDPKPDKNGSFNVMIRTTHSAFIWTQDTLFLFDKGTLGQMNDEGVASYDSYNVIAMPADEIMPFVIQLMSMYDDMAQKGAVTSDQYQMDLVKLVAFLEGE